MAKAPKKAAGKTKGAKRAARAKPAKTKRKSTRSDDKSTKSAFDRLTFKQKVFVIKYMECFCATKAAIAAGYSRHTAGSNVDKLLKNTKIQRAIRDEFEIRGVSREAILMSLAKIGFGSDIADFEAYLAGEKDLRTIREGGYDTSLIKKASEKRQVLRDSEGDDCGEVIHRTIEMYSRLDALGQIGRVLGLVSEKRVHSGKVEAAAGVVIDMRSKSNEELMRIAHALEPVDTDADVGDGRSAGKVGNGKA